MSTTCRTVVCLAPLLPAIFKVMDCGSVGYVHCLWWNLTICSLHLQIYTSSRGKSHVYQSRVHVKANPLMELNGGDTASTANDVARDLSHKAHSHTGQAVMCSIEALNARRHIIINSIIYV